MDRWMFGCWMDGGWMADGWIDRWMMVVGWMDGCVDGWMDGRIGHNYDKQM